VETPASFAAFCIALAKKRSQGSTPSPIDSDCSHQNEYPYGVPPDPSPHDVSMAEALGYYAGISPDPPKLVYRTGKTPWIKPTGLEAYYKPKELRTVSRQKINEVWGTLGREVCNL
jgi:hypothetical protein